MLNDVNLSLHWLVGKDHTHVNFGVKVVPKRLFSDVYGCVRVSPNLGACTIFALERVMISNLFIAY